MQYRLAVWSLQCLLAVDHEVVRAMRGVEPHKVPEERSAADLHHRPGLEVGLLGEAGAEATGEDDGLRGACGPRPCGPTAGSWTTFIS